MLEGRVLPTEDNHSVLGISPGLQTTEYEIVRQKIITVIFQDSLYLNQALLVNTEHSWSGKIMRHF